MRIDEQGLFARRRVRSDERMDMTNRRSTDYPSHVLADVRLLGSRMDSLQTVQTLSELGRQSPIRLNLVHEERVSSTFRLVQDIQESCSGRLSLVCDVGVPGDRAGSGGEKGVKCAIPRSPMHDMYLWMAFGGTTRGMDVKSAEAAHYQDEFDHQIYSWTYYFPNSNASLIGKSAKSWS